MKTHNLTKILALILFALFICALLLGLVAGVRVYSSLVQDKNQSDAVRYSTGLLMNSVRDADSFDAVLTGEGPEGEALVLVERSDAGIFETRIYAYEDAIVQEFAAADSEYNPEAANKIMDSEIFMFTYDDNLLTIMTDAGTSMIGIRSAGRTQGAAL